jgi:hypothetical protein
MDTKLAEQWRGYFQRCGPREEAMEGIGGDEDDGGASGDVSDVAGATEME